MKKIIFFILVLFSLNIYAEERVIYFKNGNQLYQKFDDEDPMQKAYAIGYVIGLVDSLVNSGEVCFTKHYTAGQFTDLATKYLKDNPAIRHYAASSLLIPEFKKNFPCR